MKYTLIAIIFLSWYPLYSQNDFDSEYPTPLIEKSYDELDSLFFVTEHTPEIAVEYASAYLQKAKKLKDSFEIPRGYKYFAYLNKDSVGLKYCDSLIYSSLNLNSKYYPAFGYMLKGYLLYELGDDKKALENYILANKYAVKSDNTSHIIEIKQAISVLKDKWGEHKEALKLNSEIYNFIRNQPDYNSTYKLDYLISLYNLSLSYINNKMLDSAHSLINEGIAKTKHYNDSTLKSNFKFLKGVALFKNKEYKEALISIEDALPNINDKNLILSNLYIGKIYNHYGNTEKSVYYLKKADSLVQRTNHYDPEITEAYQILFDYYKSKNDLKNQLKYIDKYIYVDSIIKNNYVNLNRTISKKYDIPQLISEKQKIISGLQDKQHSNLNIIIYLGIASSLFLLLFFIYYLKQKTYKKRLQAVLDKNYTEEVPSSVVGDKKKELDIEEFTVQQILKNLKEFESGTQYLQEGISLASLSKKFNTNSSYLSKVINTYREKNFSNYLNDLRINNAIERLKHDEKFRLYSVKAIAEETGFSNSQSFSNAFYKKTGIQPSYFIAQLKKLDA